MKYKAYTLFVCLLMLLSACGNSEEEQKNALAGRWKQTHTYLNGSLLADEQNPVNNVIFTFTQDSVFEIELAKGKIEGTYQLMDLESIKVQVQQTVLLYNIQQIDSQHLELKNMSEGTLLHFKRIE